MNDLIDRLRAYADLIYNNGITRKLRRHSVAALLHESADEIESLRSEVERVTSWNARVSVCRDHVTDIVDGLCVICSLRAAEERADNLQEEVERVTCELMDAITRADKLAEALRLALDSHGVMLMTDPPQDAWKVHRVEEIGRALLREQDKGGGYWPEMPKNGGPDWTGFDG